MKTKDKKIGKESCFICKGIRKRKELIALRNGKSVHNFHKGVTELMITELLIPDGN